jgi:hypothetical protein
LIPIKTARRNSRFSSKASGARARERGGRAMRAIFLALFAAAAIGVFGAGVSAAPFAGAALERASQATSAVAQADLIPGWRKRPHPHAKWLSRRVRKSR